MDAVPMGSDQFVFMGSRHTALSVPEETEAYTLVLKFPFALWTLFWQNLRD